MGSSLPNIIEFVFLKSVFSILNLRPIKEIVEMSLVKCASSLKHLVFKSWSPFHHPFHLLPLQLSSQPHA